MMKLFDRTMFIAISALVALSLGMLLLSEDTEPNKFSTANHALSYFTELFWCVLVIFLVRLLRGNEVERRKNPGVKFELTVWGYFWRGLLIKYLALILSVILVLLTRLDPKPSFQYTLVFSILSYMSSIFLMWLIFSKNRKEQMAFVFALFRGY